MGFNDDVRTRNFCKSRRVRFVLNQYADLAPPVLIHWNFQDLQDFVARANATHPRAAELPNPPRWLKVRVPYMTAASLTRDMVEFLEDEPHLADARFGSIVLVPRTMQHYSRMLGRLAIMEVNPFMQAVLNEAPGHKRIAAIGILHKGPRGYQRVAFYAKIRRPIARYLSEVQKADGRKMRCSIFEIVEGVSVCC